MRNMRQQTAHSLDQNEANRQKQDAEIKRLKQQNAQLQHEASAVPKLRQRVQHLQEEVRSREATIEANAAAVCEAVSEILEVNERASRDFSVR